MFSPSQPSVFEQTRGKWPVWLAAAYMRGRGVHLGGAQGCIFPKRAVAPGVYCVVVDDQPGPDAQIAAPDASMLRKDAWDWVCVEGRTPEQLRDRMRQAHDLVKDRGYIVTITPLTEDSGVVAAPKGWEVRVRHHALLGGVECVVVVWGQDRPQVSNWRKRACVVRYGAFGDQIIMTPVLRELRAAGYHVTVNASVGPHVLLDNNPNVDNVVAQERDVVLNADLGEYWKFWSEQYDRFINLSESVEGALLRVEGRRNYFTPAENRRMNAEGVNYYDRTLDIAGFPGADPTPEFYPTKRENDICERLVRECRKRRPGPVVLWTLKGSSHHKVFPMTLPTVETWLARHGGTVLLGGGPDAAMWAIDDPDRGIVSLVGKHDIRTAFALTKHVDLVVGPETGVMNAAGCFDTPKVLLLSHSRAESLSKHWSNCVALEPDTAVAPCFPCYQMHYTLESCPRVEMYADDPGIQPFVTPKCTVAITPERVISAMETQLALRDAPVTTKR